MSRAGPYNKRAELKQVIKNLGCLRLGDVSHYCKDCNVDSNDESVKQNTDGFQRAKKASDRREENENRKRSNYEAT